MVHYILFILLLLMVNWVEKGNGIYLGSKCFEESKKIMFASYPRKCPCFVHAVFATHSSAPIRARLHAITEDEYNSWLSLPTPKAPPKTHVSLNESSFQNATTRPGEPLYGWAPEEMQVAEPGIFRIIATISLSSLLIPPSTCIKGKIFLETKPDACPLRLAPPAAAAAGNYIVAGTEVDEWMEFTGYNVLVSTESGSCSGSLISNQWVLTAAHCKVDHLTSVRIGGTTLDSGKFHNVSYAVTHPSYYDTYVDTMNDIALIRLSQPVENATYLQINSNNEGPDPGTIVRATGYGSVTTDADSKGLRMVDNIILSTKECKDRYFEQGKYLIANSIIDAVHLCTGRDTGCEIGGVCTGDSGGPIVARIPDGSLVQVGITSYGEERCGNPNSGDVYTRISRYIDWIQETTENAATPVKWASINNVAITPDYDTEDSSTDNDIWTIDANRSARLPTWAIVISVLSACAFLVGMMSFITVLSRRNRIMATTQEHQQGSSNEINGENVPPPSGSDVEAAPVVVSDDSIHKQTTETAGG